MFLAGLAVAVALPLCVTLGALTGMGPLATAVFTLATLTTVPCLVLAVAAVGGNWMAGASRTRVAKADGAFPF